MNPNDIAPMVMAVTLFLVVGGVILLRPITKRLGSLLEAMTQTKREPTSAHEISELRQNVSNLESRLSLLEERQNFAEALLLPGNRLDALARTERSKAESGAANSRDPSES